MKTTTQPQTATNPTDCAHLINDAYSIIHGDKASQPSERANLSNAMRDTARAFNFTRGWHDTMASQLLSAAAKLERML